MSKKIKKILVPLDGSKNSFRGLNEAILVARYAHSTITGLYVIPYVRPTRDVYFGSYRQYFVKHAKKFMKKAKILSTKKGISFSEKIQWGNQGLKIVSYAENQRFDLIVIGSSGKGLATRFFLGSTSNYVVHKSKVPVLLVK